MQLATVRRGTLGWGEPLVSVKKLLVWLLFLHLKKLKRREIFKGSMKMFIFLCNLWAPVFDLYEGLIPAGWKHRRVKDETF